MRSATAAIKLPTGQFVEHPHLPGIGRVGDRRGPDVQVEVFESIAAPVAQTYWLPAVECRAVHLLPQTRVFWQDPDTGRWRAGRVIGGGPEIYFVRLPNKDVDYQVAQANLRVRWDQPITSPVEVLAAGANESPHFRDARLPMLGSLIAQRAACADLTALPSAAIEIYPHQLQAALTVLSDPVQRYLLADEVGLGKTIEAGLVIRQRLLDQPTSRIVVVAPDMLRQQWNRELREKFFTEDFPAATLKITCHETPDRWAEYHGFDLVVVDEAHRLTHTTGPSATPYRQLAQLAHSTPRLLLLSATPSTSNPLAHLSTLHLLDPVLYRWEDSSRFAERFEARRALANAVFGLDADFEALIPSVIAEIADLVASDEAFSHLSAQVTDLLTPDGDLIEESERVTLRERVDALRAHISETYRLHRRMIRHRRHNVLAAVVDDNAAALPFEVTGRQRPTELSSGANEDQRASDLLLKWQQDVARWLLDHHLDDRAHSYGRVLAVLSSRSVGSAEDLLDAVRWRVNHDDQAAARAGLTDQEQDLLAQPEILLADHALLHYLDEDTADPELDVRELVQVISRHVRTVIFCGAGSLAPKLRQALTPLHSACLEHTQRQGAAASATSVQRWQLHGGVLIADDSAEDGVNLQAADAVIHMRLPASPNRCEQRLGRVDRFAGALGAERRAAAQYIVAAGHAENSFPAAWTALLTEAIKIFDESASALQDALDTVTEQVWEVALRDGPAAMLATADMLTETLRQERREIDGMDTLEAVHEGTLGRSVAEAMSDMEVRWGVHERAMRLYAGTGPGGLRFAVQPTEGARNIIRFERARADPLISPRLLALSGRSVPSESMLGTFNRNTALRQPGTRLFRLGNPFVDLLANVVLIDDRGQACVLWRPGHREQDLHGYFGFDFLVEADIAPAADLVRGAPDAQRALRRQADIICPPLIQRVWVASEAEQAVDDAALLRWLEGPYSPDRDVNLNGDRISRLWDHFGSIEGLAASARRVETHARDELARSARLLSRAEHAQQEASRVLAVRGAQAAARRNATQLLSDTDSYLTDVRVTTALVDALGQPNVRLMGVTCVVGGRLEAGPGGH